MITRASLLPHFFHVCDLGHHWQLLSIETVIKRITEKFGSIRTLREYWDQNRDWSQNKKCLLDFEDTFKLSGTVSHWCKKKSVAPEWRQSPGVCVSKPDLVGKAKQLSSESSFQKASVSYTLSGSFLSCGLSGKYRTIQKRYTLKQGFLTQGGLY